MSDALRTDDYEKNGSFTYADYLKWEGPQRYQLFDGEAFMMASPSVLHQGIVREILLLIGNWLKGKPCKVFASPLDVRLFPKPDKSDKTVLQPDLLVVCDNNKIGKNSINGAPDLVIEVISPSNTHSDLFRKFQYYLEAKVKEYWIVDPDVKKVHVHIFDNGRYITTIYNDNAVIPVSVLPGFEIALADLWAEIII